MIDQKTLRQINRNEYGFCEDCLEKEKELLLLQRLITEQTEAINQHNREIGKLEEQNNRLKKMLKQAGIKIER